MDHSQPQPLVALRVPKRAAFIIVGLIGIVVILIAASTLFLSNQADQLQAISAYQTQCWIGTQGAESYVFIYNFYGTSTPTPSPTSIVAALTAIAQQPTILPNQ